MRVATNPDTVNIVRSTNALTEPAIPVNAPTRNDAAAPSRVRHPVLYATYDIRADSAVASIAVVSASMVAHRVIINKVMDGSTE